MAELRHDKQIHITTSRDDSSDGTAGTPGTSDCIVATQGNAYVVIRKNDDGMLVITRCENASTRTRDQILLEVLRVNALEELL